VLPHLKQAVAAYVYDVVVKKFTFAISSADELLVIYRKLHTGCRLVPKSVTYM